MELAVYLSQFDRTVMDKIYIRSLRAAAVFTCCLLLAAVGLASPKVLEPSALSSPSRHLKANVEWEDIGFMGVIRMKLFHPNGDPYFSVELPEINPFPANLIWIDDDWVGCESFLGDRGSGFFYVHVPSRRGYLVDIIAPKPGADWVLNFSTNDANSTAGVRTLTHDRDSLFPILMRDLPTEGPDYFTTDFCSDLREAVDSYISWRKKQNIRDIDLLSDADVRTSSGAIAVANIDQVPTVVYFPLGTTTTAQMLERVQRKPLPKETHPLVLGVDAPHPRARWTDNSGAFKVEAVDSDNPSSVSILMTGRFEGVHDEPFVAAEETGTSVEIAPETAKAKKPIAAAKDKPPRSSSKSKSSSGKKPSRAH